jgi:hypothetical protein
VNFDFVPGDRVLFYDDYSADNVGDFPRRIEFEEGNAEIAEWESGKWLRVSKAAKFAVVLPENLPDRFTVEFDYVTNDKASSAWPILVNTSNAKDNQGLHQRLWVPVYDRTGANVTLIGPIRIAAGARSCTTRSRRRAGSPPRGSTSTRGATGSGRSRRRPWRRSARC